MQYTYVCKHCRNVIGSVNHQGINENRLGFNSLTLQERADIISYDSYQREATVHTICEYCQAALEQHPELLLERSPLQ